MLRRRLVRWVGPTLVMLVCAPAILGHPPADPAPKIKPGRTLAQVRAALGGSGKVCGERIVTNGDGSKKHYIYYARSFGVVAVAVEFTTRQDNRGKAVPDRTTGEVECFPSEPCLFFLDYPRLYLRLNVIAGNGIAPTSELSLFLLDYLDLWLDDYLGIWPIGDCRPGSLMPTRWETNHPGPPPGGRRVKTPQGAGIQVPRRPLRRPLSDRGDVLLSRPAGFPRWATAHRPPAEPRTRCARPPGPYPPGRAGTSPCGMPCRPRSRSGRCPP